MSHSPKQHHHGRKHKEPPEGIKAIRDLRTSVINEHPEKTEDAHAACKGMFACTKKKSKAEQDECYDEHKKKLEALRGKKKKGGRAKSRSRSRSKSRSRSRSASRKKSRSRK